ncbi:MAG: anthranilate phosphoribosyltransferase [Verrucomicrobiae bacterium]|nr:anthranilate phosphoribosyltransferase [Verrucomicrobiae bacterium]
MLTDLIQQLRAGQGLSPEQIRSAVQFLTRENEAAETKADFLMALAQKGETPEEITAFALELRALSVPVEVPPELRQQGILDVVGTGGDRAHTLNFSTMAALVCAAAGVAVAKHGNRAATSRCGSADVLEALGIPVDLSPAQAVACLQEHRFAFFFAPRYHPAFRHIAPARKLCAERGQRTIFNFLGPLLNPARPSAQLMGVPRPELCEPLGRVLQNMGVRRGMVVCGQAGELWLDELSTVGETVVAEFYQEHARALSRWSPEQWPLQPARLEDLQGGDPAANAAAAREILSGRDRSPRRDAVLLNAGAALFVAGAARTMTEGFELAARLVDEGEVARKIAALSRPA